MLKLILQNYRLLELLPWLIKKHTGLKNCFLDFCVHQWKTVVQQLQFIFVIKTQTYLTRTGCKIIEDYRVLSYI